MTKKPLTPAQEHALDRDGDGHAGGSPKGGNHKAAPKAKTPAASDSVQGGNGADGLGAGSDAASVSGGGGQDSISAAGGNDTIDAGASNDALAAAATEQLPQDALPIAEPTASETTSFPQDQTDASAAAAHADAVASQPAPGQPPEARLQATFDHIELHVSELAVFIRAEAEAHSVPVGQVLRHLTDRLETVLGLDD
jgi:hypothetical protein